LYEIGVDGVQAFQMLLVFCARIHTILRRILRGLYRSVPTAVETDGEDVSSIGNSSPRRLRYFSEINISLFITDFRPFHFCEFTNARVGIRRFSKRIQIAVISSWRRPNRPQKTVRKCPLRDTDCRRNSNGELNVHSSTVLNVAGTFVFSRLLLRELLPTVHSSIVKLRFGGSFQTLLLGDCPTPPKTFGRLTKPNNRFNSNDNYRRPNGFYAKLIFSSVARRLFFVYFDDKPTYICLYRNGSPILTL